MNVETIVGQAASHGGWLPTSRLAALLTVAWVAVVLAYGFLRSSGSARPDAIRPSGPLP